MLISSSVVFCSCGLTMNRLKMVNKVANPTGVQTTIKYHRINNVLHYELVSESNKIKPKLHKKKKRKELYMNKNKFQQHIEYIFCTTTNNSKIVVVEMQ